MNAIFFFYLDGEKLYVALGLAVALASGVF
jgi:hypothetical protein